MACEVCYVYIPRRPHGGCHLLRTIPLKKKVCELRRAAGFSVLSHFNASISVDFTSNSLTNPSSPSKFRKTRHARNLRTTNLARIATTVAAGAADAVAANVLEMEKMDLQLQYDEILEVLFEILVGDHCLPMAFSRPDDWTIPSSAQSLLFPPSSRGRCHQREPARPSASQSPRSNRLPSAMFGIDLLLATLPELTCIRVCSVS